VLVEHETQARDLLMRLGRSLSPADTPIDSFVLGRLLAIGGRHPLILALADLDQRGRPLATSGGGAVAGLDLTELIELAPDLVRTARKCAIQPWFLVPDGSRRLVAAMGLTGIEINASSGVDGPPASGGPLHLQSRSGSMVSSIEPKRMLVEMIESEALRDPETTLVAPSGRNGRD
jgi:hypothetical protein